MSAGKLLAVEAGVAAVGGAAYYLLGPNAKKHQKKAGLFVKKAEKEVKKDLQKAKVLATPMYNKYSPVVKESVKKSVKKAVRIIKKDIKKSIKTNKTNKTNKKNKKK